jgi:hypothetical protein
MFNRKTERKCCDNVVSLARSGGKILNRLRNSAGLIVEARAEAEVMQDVTRRVIRERRGMI